MIRKKVMAGGIVALAAVLGGGGIFAWTHRTADMETLADNQKYVYAYVTSIEGNELTYMEVDESVVEAYLASSTEDTENAEKGGDGSGVPGGSDGSGAPGGSDTAGAPEDGSGAPGDVYKRQEEVYVEAGSTVAEGDALFKIDDESMEDAKAYYEDAISDAKTALQAAQIDFESGVLEAESELSSTKLAADTAQDTCLLYTSGVIPRMIGKCNRAAETLHFENAVILGGICGNLASVFLQIRIPFGPALLCVYGISCLLYTSSCV